MSRLFTSLWQKKHKRHEPWCPQVRFCRCGDVLACFVCFSCLCSLSPDAANSPRIWGLHFQSSLLGGVSSLTLGVFSILDWPAALFRTTTARLYLSASAAFIVTVNLWLPYMYFITYSEHWTRTIPSKGECSHTTPHTPSSPTTNWETVD